MYPRRFLPGTLLLAATATLCAQTTPSFELNRDAYPIYGSMTIVQGDFNRDGKPDILMGGGSSPDDLTLQLGNGDGTFQAPLTVGLIANGPADMVAGDLNGDGKLDVVAITIVNNPNLYVWYGNGDGTFQPPLEYSTTNSPLSVTVGNFFGTGRLDIAVGENSGAIELFQNQGGGNFAPAGKLSLATTSSVTRVRAGDVNDNGSSDIAALIGTAAYVMWNDGHGDFHQAELGPYTAPTDLNVGDLNQDGMADIIISYTCNPTLTNNPDKGPQYNPCAGYDVYYGQGNNRIFKRTLVTDPGVMSGSEPWAIDVNGDGVADIGAESTHEGYGGAGLYVWLGHPDGSFDQTPQVFTATSGGFGGIAPGDWNRDGMMDFAMTLPGDGMTQIFINGGNRSSCATSRINPTITVCQPWTESIRTVWCGSRRMHTTRRP
ncbi:VCBS repeat-containing protein [Alloacidobacterium sp.]|uniref:FG-GAP repeat domain-containing protein n=1 Tax=Alloacidobacterium sp. TaxID=2951999 RepID=UPI002D416FC8|nr:VCBS repeat-containing protein [Alloacidobacterium sp.]HYK36554.1 VCBS repeat-containing protein [Alloacidobacterium sp.]